MTAKSTETFDSYTAAMAYVQANLPHIEKGSTNPAFKSKYADLADVSKAILAVTSQAGLVWTCAPAFDAEGRYVLVGTMAHVSGGKAEAVWPLNPSATPQQIGSAITYGRRYMLSCITGVVPDDDDDGNAASQARPQERQQRSGRPARQEPEPAHRPAERGPLPPDEDPWALPVAQPPVVAKDEAWVEAQLERLDTATDLDTLKAAFTEVWQAKKDGALSEADYQILETQKDTSKLRLERDAAVSA